MIMRWLNQYPLEVIDMHFLKSIDHYIVINLVHLTGWACHNHTSRKYSIKRSDPVSICYISIQLNTTFYDPYGTAKTGQNLMQSIGNMPPLSTRHWLSSFWLKNIIWIPGLKHHAMIGIRNHLFEEIYSTYNWQKDIFSFIVYIDVAILSNHCLYISCKHNICLISLSKY